MAMAPQDDVLNMEINDILEWIDAEEAKEAATIVSGLAATTKWNKWPSKIHRRVDKDQHAQDTIKSFVQACEDNLLVSMKTPCPSVFARPWARGTLFQVASKVETTPSSNYVKGVALGISEPPGIYTYSALGGFQPVATRVCFAWVLDNLPAFDIELHDFRPCVANQQVSPSLQLTGLSTADVSALGVALCAFNATNQNLVGVVTLGNNCTIVKKSNDTIIVYWHLTGAHLPSCHERGLYLFRIAVTTKETMHQLVAQTPHMTPTAPIAMTPAFRVHKKFHCANHRALVNQTVAALIDDDYAALARSYKPIGTA